MILSKKMRAIFTVVTLLSFSVTQAQVLAARVTKIHNGAQLLDCAGQFTDGDVFLLAGDITLTEPLVFSGSGNVKLDLGGHRLSISTREGDAVALEGAGGRLTVTDSGQDGVLSALCLYGGDSPSFRGSAGINVFGSDQVLVIDGAVVYASGGNFGAGIQNSGEKTQILIKSGEVTASGGLYGAGIGGGYQDFSGNIRIEDGIVTAEGGSFAAGIGTGGFEKIANPPNTPGLISIDGGRVSASGGIHGAGIGGGQLQNAVEISIRGGNVSSTGGMSGAGIGSGKFNVVGISWGGSESIAGMINISGGNIKAVGGDFGAGIGTGEGASDLSGEKILDGRKISITGGNIVALGGIGGAGLGGGSYFSGGEIIVGVDLSDSSGQDITLDATGGRQAAGIGGGKGGVAGKDISIGSGNIHAFAGDEAAGIGSGSFSLEHLEPTAPYYQQRKNISLTGGSITATAHEMAAAIGGGTGGSGCNVKISGSPKINASNTWEISIGAGKFSYDQGSLIIDGGNLRTSGDLGIQPKNSDGKPVYRGTFTVCSKEESRPLSDAAIDILLNDSQTFSVKTSVDGMAVVYLPEDITPMDVRVGNGRFGFGDGGDLKFSRDGETNKTFAISEELPLKILSREATYYVNQKSDVLPLEYEGGVKELLSFNLLNNNCNMQIDPRTGILKIPVNIKTGLHNFTINAYENGVLADSADFALTVKNPLIELLPSEKEVEISTGETRFFSFSTYPADAEVIETSWRVTSENGLNSEIVDLFAESREKKAMFSASVPGLYQITVAAKDSDSNAVSETITVNVTDESAPVSLIIPTEGGPFTAEANVPATLPAIGAWSAERIDGSTARVYFDSNTEGIYKYELVAENQIPNGIFLVGSPVSTGENSITVAGLADDGAYEFRIKLADKTGLESGVRSVIIPSYNPADILPPTLREATLLRLSGNEARLTFSSDKDGKIYYSISDRPNKPHGLTWFDFQETSPLVKGNNKVTISGIDKAASRTLYVIAEDDKLNRSKVLEFVIPAYEDPLMVAETETETAENPAETLETTVETEKTSVETAEAFSEPAPVLTAGEARRTGTDSATVSIHALSYGEYYCAVVQQDSPAPGLDVTKGAYAISPGKNTVNLTGLMPGLPYDVYILYKDETGRTSNPVRVVVPA